MKQNKTHLALSTTKPLNNKNLEMLETLKVNIITTEVPSDFNTYDIQSSKQDTQVNYNMINHEQQEHKKFEHLLFIMSLCILIVAFGFAIWSLL